MKASPLPESDLWRARLRRAWPERWLLLAVLILLGMMRLAILVLPFRRLARWLGPADRESCYELTPEQREQAKRVRAALQTVSQRTPWTSNCFPQALTGLALLKMRKVPCTLYLGARFADDDDGNTGSALRGHAWLRAGRVDVCGGRVAAGYGTLARYGAPPRPADPSTA